MKRRNLKKETLPVFVFGKTKMDSTTKGVMNRKVLWQIAISSALGFIIGFMVGLRFNIVAGALVGFTAAVLICGLRETATAFHEVKNGLVERVKRLRDVRFFKLRLPTPSVRERAKVPGFGLRRKWIMVAPRLGRPLIAFAIMLVILTLCTMAEYSLVILANKASPLSPALFKMALILSHSSLAASILIPTAGVLFTFVWFGPVGQQEIRKKNPLALPMGNYLARLIGFNDYPETPYDPIWHSLERIDPAATVSRSNLLRLFRHVHSYSSELVMFGWLMMIFGPTMLILDVLITVILKLMISKKIAAGIGAAAGLILEYCTRTAGDVEAVRLLAFMAISTVIGVGVYRLKAKILASAVERGDIPTTALTAV